MEKKTKRKINKAVLDNISKEYSLDEATKDFILYYLESFNVSQSYLKSHPGSTKKEASKNGYKLMHKDKVKSEIARLKKAMQKEVNVDVTRFIDFFEKGANADIGDFISFSEEEINMYNSDGTLMIDHDTGKPITRKINKMHLKDSESVDTSLIQEIKQGKDGISIKLVDKAVCWEKLKQYFDWKFSEKKESNTGKLLLKSFRDAISGIGKKKEDWEGDEKLLQQSNISEKSNK